MLLEMCQTTLFLEISDTTKGCGNSLSGKVVQKSSSCLLNNIGAGNNPLLYGDSVRMKSLRVDAGTDNSKLADRWTLWSLAKSDKCKLGE